jgi:hypothetical protein
MARLPRPTPTLARIPTPPVGTVSRAVTNAAVPVRRALALPTAVVPAGLLPLGGRPPRPAADRGNTGRVAAALTPGRTPARRRFPRRPRLRPVRRLLALRHLRVRFAGTGQRTRTGSGRGSRWSASSVLSFLSFGSGASVASALSLFSAGSILSVGSAGSILSIGSAGSILSVGSAGSILSIGSAGSILGIGGDARTAAGEGGDGRTAPPRLLHGTATVLGATALLAAATGR